MKILREDLPVRTQNLAIECAGFLIPPSLRKEWLLKWQSEVWYVRREAPAEGDVWKFCLGAFRDALWVRAQFPRKHICSTVDSPLDCVLFLNSLLFLALLIAVLLPESRHILQLSLRTNWSFYWAHSWAGVSENPANLIDQQIVIFRLSFMLSCLVLPSLTPLSLGSGHRPNTLQLHLLRSRGIAFFLVKLMLILALVYLAALDLGSLLAPGGDCFIQTVATLVGFSLSLRWTLNDHRARCPHCLHRLCKPLRMGQESWILLDWNLVEFMCPKGHGVLHVPAESISGHPIQRWVSLDFDQGTLSQ